MAAKSHEMEVLIKRFRNRTLDHDAALNILTGDKEFTDEQIEGFIIEALYDINEAQPRQTKFVIKNMPNTGLLLDGALVFMYKARGLLHLRNQVSYSDAGFSVNLDDKMGYYSQLASAAEQQYRQDLLQFKRSLVPRMRGIRSPMGRWY